jgi:hypothetical protein
MEFVILGLLALRAMTVYEINKALERGVSLFYSASFGSINAAIGRLLEKGWISGQEKVENGRNKKIFQLTPRWDGKPSTIGSIRTSKPKKSKTRPDPPVLHGLYFCRRTHPRAGSASGKTAPHPGCAGIYPPAIHRNRDPTRLGGCAPFPTVHP